MWKMYVVRCSDGSYYCGITTDTDRRLNEHNGVIKKKGAKYTRSRRPVVLFYEEDHPDRSSASKSEAAFKKMNRQQKLSYMADQVTTRLEKEMIAHQKRSASE
tara:strand:- start:272 stop:580 length:309 start_codon:yes stop_codon:yes gene_type:complete